MVSTLFLDFFRGSGTVARVSSKGLPKTRLGSAATYPAIADQWFSSQLTLLSAVQQSKHRRVDEIKVGSEDFPVILSEYCKSATTTLNMNMWDAPKSVPEGTSE